MTFRWFISRTVRHATAFASHVGKTLSAQRDLLSPTAIEAVQAAIRQVRTTIAAGANAAQIEAEVAALEKTAAKWLKPYPHASVRENIEVIVVAVAVALGIRTFFLQPFKIPTGSMQPTLYGITGEDLRGRTDARIPSWPVRVFDFCIRGVSYHHIVARDDGTLDAVEPPRRILPLVWRQRFRVGQHWYSVWSAWERLPEAAGLVPRRLYRRGDDLVKLKVLAGDHLFVDRMTYNFRRPTRGEILVFETRGIRSPLTGLPAMPQDQFYVKRMVAMDREQVQIGDDRHLRINGTRLDASQPRFENIYAFDPKHPPKRSTYSGHLNRAVAKPSTSADLAPLFPDARTTVTIRPNHYMVMGDNTLDSYDGRAWGDFSRTNVIGKYCFVYWPITSRFGWAAR